jgi:parallel beta-helix repeat protein
VRKSKEIYFNFLIRLFIVFFLSALGGFSLNYATIRYVSHFGSNTYPYTSWATSADSIMTAISVSSSGDTIYVANGVYEEQVVMIPGLSLFGTGMDSCVINGSSLAYTGYHTVEVVDSCIFRGFTVIAYYSSDMGTAIAGGGNSLIRLNKATNAIVGILAGSDVTVYENICISNRKGIEINNSSSVVRGNYINSNYFQGIGINITAFNLNFIPIIDSNYIVTDFDGIKIAFGTKPTITNNIIILRGNYAKGFFGSYTDTTKILNNLFIAENAETGIISSTSPHLILNNYLANNFSEDGMVIQTVNNKVENNVVTNGYRGIRTGNNPTSIFKYNNSWNNTVNYSGFTPDSTNLSVDPMIVNDDTTQGDLDFHLQKYSPLIDAGDPNILDRDGSRSDIGLYGGPYGWTYTYQDLAPRPPHNVTAAIEDGLVKLTWNKNTETDFSHYRIYRDTVTIVIYDSSKIVGETPDTVFYDNLPPVNKETSFYYVITAFDNQGNQSYPSEEIVVTVTEMTEHPPKGYDGYRLLSNYPNPFNPSTVIPYRLKEAGYVKLYVYDVKGELVRVLVNEWQEKGYYEIEFRPNAEERQRANSFEVPMGKTYSDIATGVYIYMIHVYSDRKIPVYSDSGKMILLK